jgi:hypothetical protein
MRLIVAAFVALAAATPASAQVVPFPSHEPVPVVELDWMTGVWVSEANGAMTQEAWTHPNFGAMSGVGQTTGLAREPRFEFMTITTVNSRPVFIAHIKGQAPTPFGLKHGPAGEAVFENREHDFPQRIIYRKCDEDLCARIEGTVDGKAKAVDWRYRRVR